MRCCSCSGGRGALITALAMAGASLIVALAEWIADSSGPADDRAPAPIVTSDDPGVDEE